MGVIKNAAVGMVDGVVRAVESLFPLVPEVDPADRPDWQPPAKYFFLDDTSLRLSQRIDNILRGDGGAVSFFRKRNQFLRERAARLRAVRDIPRVRVLIPVAGGYLLERMDDVRYPDAVGQVRLPDGAVRPGEAERDAAVRELAEELGVVASTHDLVYMGTAYNTEWDHREYYYYYYYYRWSPAAGVPVEPGFHRDRSTGRLVEYVVGPLGGPHWCGPVPQVDDGIVG